MGFLLSMFGGAFGAEPTNGRVSTEDGFVDIDIPITQSKAYRSSGLTVVARGRFDQKVVGFALDLDPKWDEKPIENADAFFYWGTAHIRSIGEESDSFAQLLSHFYKLPCSSPKMPIRIEVQAVGLANDPRLAKTRPTKMKFFFNSNSEQNYAEVFLNLDLASKVLQFHEKDPEYRAPLLRAICGES